MSVPHGRTSRMEPAARHHFIFATTSGFCGVAWGHAGITRFQLPGATREATERRLLRREPGSQPAVPTPEIAALAAAVVHYFEGKEIDFAGVKLDLSGLDAFHREIYGALRRVGWGCTTTYGALARELGFGPEVARDVGQAMANNPVALIIPCHRVLAAGGKLGGFSAPGGSSTKARMLELEGIRIDPPLAVQPSLF
jgi:methylated-DNA-[protein]-cysteine S-methyltransferase